MTNPNFYHQWQLGTDGKTKRVEIKIGELKPFILDLIRDLELDTDTAIITELRSQYPQPQAHAALRCAISHILKKYAVNLYNDYGNQGNRFVLEEINPYFFEDHQPIREILRSGKYDPPNLYTKIIDRYDPEKGNFPSWVTKLAYEDSGIKDFLEENGLIRRTDWALLKDCRPRSLRKKLGVHLTPKELTLSQELLIAFQDQYLPYWEEKKADGVTKCPPPTQAMLTSIAEQLNLSPSKVLERLRQLAQQLRNDVAKRSLHNLSLDHDREDGYKVEPEADDPSYTKDEINFWELYNLALAESFFQSIHEGIEHQCQQYREKRREQYLQILKLFFIDGLNQTEVAEVLGRSSSNICHTANLNKLREFVLVKTVPLLKDKVIQLAQEFTTPERINNLTDQLNKIILESITEIIDEDSSATKGRDSEEKQPPSWFARIVAQVLKKFYL